MSQSESVNETLVQMDPTYFPGSHLFIDGVEDNDNGNYFKGCKSELFRI